MAGVTFSITIVAVSYASGNIGHRLVQNFMRDRGNQYALGTFIATFVYCLMVLHAVQTAAGDGTDASFDAFVPHLSVLVAIFLALISMCVLIYFFHHVPETISVGNIAARIGTQLADGVQKLFPTEEERQPKRGAPSWGMDFEGLSRSHVKAHCAGYVQTLDIGRLEKIAGEENLRIEVLYRPGDFVVRQDAVLDIWGSQKVSEETIGKLQGCYAVGQHRTPHQNVLFLVDELVEIIARALSPGINDPFTAIICIDWLKISLTDFALRENDAEADQYRSSAIEVRSITFEEFVSAICDQSRQYICGDRNAAVHMIEVLAETAALLPPGPRRKILMRSMRRMADACAETLATHEGGSEVSELYKDSLRALSDPDGFKMQGGANRSAGGRTSA